MQKKGFRAIGYVCVVLFVLFVWYHKFKDLLYQSIKIPIRKRIETKYILKNQAFHRSLLANWELLASLCLDNFESHRIARLNNKIKVNNTVEVKMVWFYTSVILHKYWWTSMFIPLPETWWLFSVLAFIITTDKY